MTGDVGLTGYGRYVPDGIISAEEIAEQSEIPLEIVAEKMGIQEKHVCPPDDDHVTDMGCRAARGALEMAGLEANELDLVCYHGSEYKDYIVWSAAADIAHRLGAEGALATEIYGLCAGAPITLRQAKALLVADELDSALLVAASREEDLVDYTNQDSSFMFNFGSGASAMVVERDPGERSLGTVHGSAALTDGSFAGDVVMPGGGSKRPPTHETVDAGLHTLDVPDPDGMKERLRPVSLPNFLTVADDALERSGYGRDDLDFVAVTHMKRSFTEALFDELGLDLETDGYYLEDYGHVQSADQVIAIDEALAAGRLDPGDLVCFLGAGTGYTWAATVLRWHGGA
jgi:3-oxoacyl-[acyl-carrier-protein] synthase-3